MDRNPFIPPAPRSALGLTLGMVLTVLAAIIVGVGVLVAQMSAFASPVSAMLHAPVASPKFEDRLVPTPACRSFHFLRFDDAGALAHVQLIADCPGEEPHAVLEADCTNDPVACSIVLGSGLDDVPGRTAYHVDKTPAASLPSYGGADVASLSMVTRAF